MTQSMQEFLFPKLTQSSLMERLASITLTGSSRCTEKKLLRLTSQRSKSKRKCKILEQVIGTLFLPACSMLPLFQGDKRSLTTSTSVVKSLSKESLLINKFLIIRLSVNLNLREARTSLSWLATCLLSKENWSPRSRRDKFSPTKACQSARCYSILLEPLMCQSGCLIMKTMTSINTMRRIRAKRKIREAFKLMMTFSKKNKLKHL